MDGQKEKRIGLCVPLLSENGSFLCHIDEHEYERLHLSMDNTGLLNAGTVIWDKKNPMMEARGIATRHEYILWRTKHQGTFYLKSTNVHSILAKSEEIIEKHEGVNDKARKEFFRWVESNGDFTGGERAYKFLDSAGQVYRGVAMVWPNPNPAPEKFFVPLTHPVTKKPCPVPERGWSQSPEKMKGLLEKEEILFGKDETTQPQRKIYLTEESKRSVSTVIPNGKRGKTEIDNLGLEFSYCHPTSLYEELVNAASINGNGIALDFFAGSGTTAHAVKPSKNSKLNINLHNLYPDIDIAESLANTLGKQIRKRTADSVIFTDDTTEKTNPAKMTEEGKQHFISLIRPYLWWGE